MTEPIDNGESGLSVRNKLNEVISTSNSLVTTSEALVEKADTIAIGASNASEAQALMDTLNNGGAATGTPTGIILSGNSNMGGADLWLNSTGEPDGAFIRGATIRGVSRRRSRLLNTVFNIGDRNTLVSGTGGVSSHVSLENFHIEGSLRVFNVEQTPILYGMSIFGSDALNDASGYGAGHLVEGVAEPIGSICGMLGSNHGLMMGCNVNNGYETLAEGSQRDIDGVGIAGSVNTTIISGTINNNAVGVYQGADPTYTATGFSEKLTLLGVHFEDNNREAVRCDFFRDLHIDSHIRGSVKWDYANYPLVTLDGASSVVARLAGTFRGSLGLQSGVGIHAVNGSTYEFGGSFIDLETAIQIDGSVDGYKINPHFFDNIAPGREIIIHRDATAAKIPAKAGGWETPLSINRDMVSVFDDFMTGPGSEWTTLKGTSAAAVDFAVVPGAGGVIQATTGNDAGSSMANNGVQINHGLNWRASNGELALDIRAGVDSTASQCLFIGFTDQAAALEMPVTLGAGDAPTAVATNAVGFLYDTFADTDELCIIGVNAGVATTPEFLGFTPQGASTLMRFNLSVDASGNASFSFTESTASSPSSFDGHVASAVAPSALLTPVVAMFPRSAASRILQVDYIGAQGRRDK